MRNCADADPAGDDPGNSRAVDNAICARPGSDGSEIAELLPKVQAIDKLDFGSFGCEEFRSALRELPGPRTTLLLCGMECHICVMQTALGALENGYMVHVASDAVSSRTDLNWRLGLERMESAGCVISSTEMMMYELLAAERNGAV